MDLKFLTLSRSC